MSQILIICSDMTMQDAVQCVLKRHEYDRFCKVETVQGFDENTIGTDCCMIGLGIEKIGKKNVNHHFQMPLRIGGVLDKIVAIQKNRESVQGLQSLPIGAYHLDPVHFILENRETGAETRLTEKEAGILRFLYVQKGRSVRRAELLRAIWGYADNIETHTLETHMYRLRQKIEDDPANPKLIITDDDGYRLNESE